MIEIDSVIVTVRTKDEGFSMDLDMPSKEPVGTMKPMLLEILRIVDNRVFSRWHSLEILHPKTDNRLSPEDTLEEPEIWDGSILCRTMN